MPVQQNIQLRPYHTFGIHAMARYFAVCCNQDEFEEYLHAYPRIPVLILGSGSNILFKKNYDGLVLKNEIKGIAELHEDSEYVYVKAGAGEIWQHFVHYCIQRNWGGLENLSGIPGTVGASPIQNIGAYGAEMEEVFCGLEAWHIADKKAVTFTRSDCAFGYRDSVFKNKFRSQFVVLNVTVRLRKKPRFNISYGALSEELEKMEIQELSIRAISEAVLRIRAAKLPDPSQIANAGSFFKNPEVTVARFNDLKKKFPELIAYPMAYEKMKLSAGWLMAQCGWKGVRRGDAGCYDRHALVLVNYGNATGEEIWQLSCDIIKSVHLKFGIEMEREVNVL